MSDPQHEEPKAQPQEQPPAEPAPEAEPASVARLKRRGTSDLRRQKHLAAAAIVGVVAFVAIFYLPSMSTLSTLHERIVTHAQQLQSDRERGRNLPALRETADRLERELAAFKPLPRGDGLNQLLQETGSLARQLRLRGFRSEPQQPTVNGPLGVLPVRLTFDGNFENAYSFIRRCEELSRPVRVLDLTVRQKPGEQGGAPRPGEVSVEMVLNVFYDAGGPAGA